MKRVDWVQRQKVVIKARDQKRFTRGNQETDELEDHYKKVGLTIGRRGEKRRAKKWEGDAARWGP